MLELDEPRTCIGFDDTFGHSSVPMSGSMDQYSESDDLTDYRRYLECQSVCKIILGIFVLAQECFMKLMGNVNPEALFS